MYMNEINGSNFSVGYVQYRKMNKNAQEKAMEIIDFITHKCEPLDKNKFCYRVQTAHGMHLITTPFNTQKFGQQFPDIDVHKNNPTLLYFNCLE